MLMGRARGFQEWIGTLVRLEQGVEPGAERVVPGASPIEERLAHRAVGPLQGLTEEGFFLIVGRFHRRRFGYFTRTCVF